MNNFNMRNYELNEAKKRMNMTNPASNMTSMSNMNMTSDTNYSLNSNVYSNLSNSTSIDSNELAKARQKMNNYSSTNTSNNSMY